MEQEEAQNPLKAALGIQCQTYARLMTLLVKCIVNDDNRCWSCDLIPAGALGKNEGQIRYSMLPQRSACWIGANDNATLQGNLTIG
jgi:hypothetical protein